MSIGADEGGMGLRRRFMTGAASREGVGKHGGPQGCCGIGFTRI